MTARLLFDTFQYANDMAWHVAISADWRVLRVSAENSKTMDVGRVEGKQAAIILQQDDRSTGCFTSERDRLRCGRIRLGGGWVGIRVLKQPRLEFEGQHTAD